MINSIKIASRKSTLALWQANWVKTQLHALFPKIQCDIVGIQTKGDLEQSKPLYKIGGKSLFVKTLQTALLTHKADCAVHCIKDMSVHPTPGLTMASLPTRHDPRDVLVSKEKVTLETLPHAAIIGTSSPRRASLLKKMRSDLQIMPIRGNIQTRLKKLQAGEFDAIILAAAGLCRLNLTAHIQQYFNTSHFIPAIGQGALGIECRQDEPALIEILQTISDLETTQCIEAEQAVNRILGGDCHSAIGAIATAQANALSLSAMVVSPCGKHYIEASGTDSINHPTALGHNVAHQLIALGAKEILSIQE